MKWIWLVAGVATLVVLVVAGVGIGLVVLSGDDKSGDKQPATASPTSAPTAGQVPGGAKYATTGPLDGCKLFDTAPFTSVLGKPEGPGLPRKQEMTGLLVHSCDMQLRPPGGGESWPVALLVRLDAKPADTERAYDLYKDNAASLGSVRDVAALGEAAFELEMAAGAGYRIAVLDSNIMAVVTVVMLGRSGPSMSELKARCSEVVGKLQATLPRA